MIDKLKTEWIELKIDLVYINAILPRISFPIGTDCWIWTGTLNKSGYGRMRIRQRNVLIHRWIYSIYNQDPGNMYVCHKCDVPNCINPNHLFLGSQQDNMNDMVLKGHSTHGSKHPKAILNETIVREILIRSYNREFHSIKQIAEEYSIKRDVIGKILNGRIWLNVLSELSVPISVIRSRVH